MSIKRVERAEFVGSLLKKIGLFLSVAVCLSSTCDTEGQSQHDADADRDTHADADQNGGSEDRPVIMLTGYWDPTGKMLRQFCQDGELNPDRWAGENWEGRGYDIVSFYPAPDGVYTGILEVDYQDTSEDFWQLVETVRPIAIMSFGAGAGPWEVEVNARNLDQWTPDYAEPFLPTPNPPDDSVELDFIRHSTLPVEDIANRVNALDLPGIGTDGAWIDTHGHPGGFLCEFMAYHGMWYQAINDECLMAGFTHVHPGVPLESATTATEEALRALIDALDEARSE